MLLAKLRTALKRKGYKIFSRPYELNIVGVRSPSVVPNSFDDFINVFYRDEKGAWVDHTFPATTDPGTYWLRQPMNVDGTAILVEGQYLDTYTIDLHKGQYLALCQRLKTVTVIRDYDRDAVLDFASMNRATGWYGINIHHARFQGTTTTVEKWSGGCQVFASVDHFNFFMQLCERHRQRYGNRFTYSLIDTRAVVRAGRLRALVASAVGLAAICAMALLTEYHNQKNQ